MPLSVLGMIAEIGFAGRALSAPPVQDFPHIYRLYVAFNLLTDFGMGALIVAVLQSTLPVPWRSCYCHCNTCSN